MFVKGANYGWCAHVGDYRKPEAVSSLEKLRETGCEWISLSFSVKQEKVFSTKIYFDFKLTAKDRDLEFTINKAHELGMKVCLKPVVDPLDNTWRGQIDFATPMLGADIYWDEWFDSYTAFMCHYAEMAEYTKCEMLCVGCELMIAERKEQHWRKVVSEVRKLYSGPLVYNANHSSEEGVKWFDAVDYVGTSGYYSVAEVPGETEENMLKAWQPVKERIKAFSEKWGKPVIFVEIGCFTIKGTAVTPGEWRWIKDAEYDEDEPANYCHSFLKTFADEPWFAGFFWWDWSTILPADYDPKTDKSANFYEKKIGEVLSEGYRKL